jgi:tetratricopeptide (TPR) repeat protein
MSRSRPIGPTVVVAAVALVVAGTAVVAGWLSTGRAPDGAPRAAVAAAPAAPAVPDPRSAPAPPPAAAAAVDQIRAAAAVKDLGRKLADDDDPHIQALKARLAQKPEDVEALLGMGDLYVKRREYSKARGYYFYASQVAPDNLEARTHLGTVAYFMGHLDEALHHYQQALALDPDYTVALFEMGAALRFGKKDLPAAVETWEHFLRLDPDAPEADRVRQLVAEAKAMIANGTAPKPVPTAPPAPAPAPATAPRPGQAPDGKAPDGKAAESKG